MPSTPLQKLAAKWRVIGLIAVAFARLMRRYEDGYVHGAAAQAEQLCICLRAAQIMIGEEIAETVETHPPETKADENALQHLRAISVALLVLHAVMLRVLPWLLGARGWARVRGGFVAQVPKIAMPQFSAGFAILDPG